MKKWILVSLVVLCATSAFAGETGVQPAPDAVTVDAVALAAPPMTLTAALDKVGQNLREMWLPNKEGKKVRRVCYLECTNYCSYERSACVSAGGTAAQCNALFDQCMCENNCCSGPYGNPYCD